VSDAAAVADLIVTSPRRPRVARRVLRQPVALIATLVVAAFVVIALGAPYFAPFDPIKPDYRAVRKAPSSAHLLGTDEVGRDVLSRLIWGARASLLAGAVPVTLALIVSLPLGLLSGLPVARRPHHAHHRRHAGVRSDRRDRAGGLFGPSHGAMLRGIAACPRSWGRRAGRRWRSPPVVSARALGCSRLRVALRHVLPNMLPPLLIQSSLTVAAAIIAEASLSFLGLGQQPPAPSWGSMLNAAQRYLSQAPWIALYPGLEIFTVVMALNVVGDGLRDALDPRIR
jgi:peptide/nickel transport system permease protein